VSTATGPFVLSLCAGAGALLIGLGIFILCLRAGALLTRMQRTLDEVDEQIGALSTPIVTTLTHVGGIADTADATIGRLGAVVTRLESVASGASKTASLIGAVVGITGSRRLDRPGDGSPPDASGS